MNEESKDGFIANEEYAENGLCSSADASGEAVTDPAIISALKKDFDIV